MNKESISQEENKENKKWLYVSVFVHSLILLFLFIIPLFSYTYLPLESQEGILVSFGQRDIGQSNDKPDTQNEKKIDIIEEKKEAKNSRSTSQSKPKKVVTQETKSAVEIKEQKDKSDAIKKSLDLAEEAKQKKLAKEKLELAEEERRQKEAEEAKKKAYQQSKKQYSDLFKGKGKGSTNENGNQGVENGDENGSALNGISTGSGTVGGGLGNRGVVSAPEVKEDSQKKGKVVLRICVDANGSVTSAEFTQRGSTTTDTYLVSLAKKSARKWQFNASTIPKQCGTITFDFKVK